MSYLCLIANQNGAALSGDSRLTLQPQHLNLHFDRAQKIFSDPKQNLIWGCCGLLFFGGVDFTRVVAHIMRQDYRSMGSRLNQITALLTHATSLRRMVSQHPASFTLLLARIKDGKLCVQTLDIVDGSAALRTLPTPTIVQAGWERCLYEPKPPRVRYANANVPTLAKIARERCQRAMQMDKEMEQAAPAHIRIIGGNVRIAALSVGNNGEFT